MKRPGVWTWAFWNSSLVTTIIGSLVFASLVSLVVVLIAHNLEKKRKLFDFQLEMYRSFITVSNSALGQLLAVQGGRSIRSEREYKAEVTRARQAPDVLRATNYQIEAAFRDDSMHLDMNELLLVTWKLLEGTTRDPPASDKEIDPLHRRYRVIATIMEVKMMREMGLIDKGFAAAAVQMLAKKLEETGTEKPRAGR